MAVSGGLKYKPLNPIRNRREEMKERLYAAYGSNINLEQMSERCPTARVMGKSKITGYKLVFRGHKSSAVASIEPQKGKVVPVLVWSVSPADEAALDVYEGWPILYRKEIFKVNLNGKQTQVFLYVMNDGRPKGVPGCYYYSLIFDGYKAAGFDLDILRTAASDLDGRED